MLKIDTSDIQLLGRLGEAEALDLFYRRHVEPITKFASRRCANPDEVVELVSVVFLEVIDSAASFDQRRGPVRPWLFGIAVRCLADLRRERTRALEAERRLGGFARLSEDDMSRAEARIDAARLAPRVVRAMASLSEGEREVLLLVQGDELSVADAARALGISPVAGRVRLARARRKVQSALTRGPDSLPVTPVVGKEC
jgi:RNA polymerase sigma-70 factor (ECF subfamily)